MEKGSDEGLAVVQLAGSLLLETLVQDTVEGGSFVSGVVLRGLPFHLLFMPPDTYGVTVKIHPTLVNGVVLNVCYLVLPVDIFNTLALIIIIIIIIIIINNNKPIPWFFLDFSPRTWENYITFCNVWNRHMVSYVETNFLTKRDENDNWKILHNAELHILYRSRFIVTVFKSRSWNNRLPE